MNQKFKVGEWLVDPAQNTLLNQSDLVSIEPKAMALLCMLVEADGDVVSRKDIMTRIWNDRYVTDYALNNLISSLRKYLNHDQSSESYIITRPKLGYQISADISLDIPSDKKRIFNVNIAQQSTHHTNTPYLATVFKIKKTTILLLASLTLVAVAFTSIQISLGIKKSKLIEPSIAVLPFDVFDKKEEIGFFADGLADEIIHQLNGIPNFKVISRRSSFLYRGKQVNVKQIAETLDVSYILEGSVRQENNTMRITLQLIDASDESLIWSRVFTANQDNGFAIQHEISAEIAQSLDMDISDIAEQNRRFKPTSGEAFLHVLRGRKLNQSNNVEDLLKARDEFLMATLLEPNYAMAQVNLAISYLLLEQNKRLSNDEASKLFNEAINKALSIDPNLADAHAARGMHLHNKHDFDNAKASFEKALELNPKLYIALVNYANLLRAYYYREESLSLYKRALEIAPLSSPVHWGIGANLRALGQFDEALVSYQNCVARAPKSSHCYLGLAYTYRLTGQNKEAEQALETVVSLVSPEDYYYKEGLAWHALWKNDLAQADNILQKHLSQFGLDIPLQTPSYVQFGLGSEKTWLQRLSQATEPTQRGLAFFASYAHAAYFNQNCKIAVEYYERMLDNQPKLIDDGDVIANAVSYAANLTYCYKMLGQLEKAKGMINQLTSILNHYPDNHVDILGLNFVKAQHAVLIGDKKRGIFLVEQLQKSNWGMKWLLDKDPILVTLSTK